MSTETTTKTLEVGKAYTMLRIDSFLAMCHKSSIVITRQQGERFIYKEKGKRKEFYAPDPAKNDNSVMYFDCPATDFKVDTDGGGIMRGNACFNFTSPSPEQLRELISAHCINPNDEMLAHCMYCNGENEELLFTDKHTNSAHIMSKRNR
mgnify:CR=1 FL=1